MVTDRRAGDPSDGQFKSSFTEAAELTKDLPRDLQRDELLSRISHELRTPMGAILGFSELMLDTSQSENERYEIASIIHRNCTYMMRLIDDVLDLSKLRTGHFKINKGQFSPRKMMSDLIPIVRQKNKPTSVEFKIVVDESVPELVISDQDRLRQILMNVMCNALKFTSSGEVLVQVHLVNTSSPVLEFIISDTGCGIPEDEQYKLFQPFTQLGPYHAGNGLGLALSRDLARALDGDLQLIKSTPNIGSTFLVEIPVAMAKPEEISDNSEKVDYRKQKHSFSESALEGFHILLAEDSPDLQNLYQRILTHAGARIEVVSNGAQAIAKVQEADFTLILMDMVMPEMNGYEATAQLRKRGFTKPILALTAKALDEEIQKCLVVGCNDIICKPVDAPVLISTIEHWTQRIVRQ